MKLAKDFVCVCVCVCVWKEGRDAVVLPLNGSIKYCPNFVREKELYLACHQPPMDKKLRLQETASAR